MKRRGWWRFAVLLVLGVVLSPLRAAAATIPVLSAYDVAVRPTATPVVGRYEAARSEAERPAFNDYDCALVGYGDHSNPPVVRDERADDAYDRAPNLPERCEVGGGVIYDAPAPTTAAEGATAAAEALPELEISASKYPDLAENIQNALGAGRSDVLTHGGDAVANRAAALQDVPNIPGLSRDEFPFASSMEGGEGAWVGHIPAAQQSAQGGLISNFLRANGIGPGMQYRVVIGP